MREVKGIFVLVLLVFVLVLGYFMYKDFVDSKNLPHEVQNSPDYLIALRSAERVRFLELGLAAVLFVLIAFGMAYYRFPRVSWLRTLMAMAITFLLLFVVFAKQMETTFQQTFPAAPLPLSALQTVGLFGAGGILLAAFIFFVTERIHVWRVAR